VSFAQPNFLNVLVLLDLLHACCQDYDHYTVHVHALLVVIASAYICIHIKFYVSVIYSVFLSCQYTYISLMCFMRRMHIGIVYNALSPNVIFVYMFSPYTYLSMQPDVYL
jgi:hypothetical protein